jgi:Arc/MetJ family transcription regulator
MDSVRRSSRASGINSGPARGALVAEVDVGSRDSFERKQSLRQGGSTVGAVYTSGTWVYTGCMAKHLVDVDEDALEDAKRELGTSTIKDTVNLALRRAGARRRDDVKRHLDVLARADLVPRDQAWR